MGGEKRTGRELAPDLTRALCLTQGGPIMTNTSSKFLRQQIERIKRVHELKVPRQYEAMPKRLQVYQRMIRTYENRQYRQREKRRARIKAVADRITIAVIMNDTKGAVRMLKAFEKAKFS